jgi:hypothetical protein
MKLRFRIRKLGPGNFEKIALEEAMAEIVFKIETMLLGAFQMLMWQLILVFQQQLSVFTNCFQANVPVISGTTGWLEKL